MLEKIGLGISTTVISMLIVFLVLFILNLIIRVQSWILSFLVKEEPSKEAVVAPVKVVKEVSKTGSTKGKAKISGVEDDETISAVIAAVSHASDIPLSKLVIKGIRRVDDNWERTSKIESTN